MATRGIPTVSTVDLMQTLLEDIEVIGVWCMMRISSAKSRGSRT